MDAVENAALDEIRDMTPGWWKANPSYIPKLPRHAHYAASRLFDNSRRRPAELAVLRRVGEASPRGGENYMLEKESRLDVRKVVPDYIDAGIHRSGSPPEGRPRDIAVYRKGTQSFGASYPVLMKRAAREQSTARRRRAEERHDLILEREMARTARIYRDAVVDGTMVYLGDQPK